MKQQGKKDTVEKGVEKRGNLRKKLKLSKDLQEQRNCRQ